jgi:DNA gyrase inhibitor GyrI
MDVRIERLKTMRVAIAHVLSQSPEEDAWGKIETWAKPRGLLHGARTRVFGRNTFPTDNPEPHGYEFFLTVGPDVEAEGDVVTGEIPCGLYAVLRFKNLHKIKDAWRHLWDWIKDSEHEHVDWKKGEHGWVNGFEERLDWHEKNPPNEWTFDLWVQLKA